MSFFGKCYTLLFRYSHRNRVYITSNRIGVTYRVLQLLIIAYIIGFAIIWKKGYQQTCLVSSAVTSKVKGVIFTDPEKNLLHVPEKYKDLYKRIWDPTDYTSPTAGEENGGFFVKTNVIITPNQTRGVCPESVDIEEAHCTDDSNCLKGYSAKVGNGVFTGKCIDNFKSSNKTCEVEAWCPVEHHKIPVSGKALLEGAMNFTVLIKNYIEFQLLGRTYKRRNIFDEHNSSYLRRCLFNPDDEEDRYCPIFRVGDMVKMANQSLSDVAIKGGVFQIKIIWDCNLDRNFVDYCKPKYSFERMDDDHASISPGYNFRTAEYHEQNRRTLFKNYGIQFLVKVSGQAGKFDSGKLLLNLGSALAVLGVATLICDQFAIQYLKTHLADDDKKNLGPVKRGSETFTVSKGSGSNSYSSLSSSVSPEVTSQNSGRSFATSEPDNAERS